jgi:hypothetical protein
VGNLKRETTMKMSDILRDLADKLAAIEGDGDAEHNHGGEVVDVEPGDNGSGEVFVPPLQAKLELLKKSSGVPSFYDNGEAELNDIKKLTGIDAVMQQEASEDNDVVG